MMISEGNKRNADYFLDCPLYELYYSMTRQKAYADKVKDQMDAAKGKDKVPLE